MIPVLTFHSIGIEKSQWTKRYLSSPRRHFEKFCEFILKGKYNSLFLDEWYRLSNPESTGVDKNIVLTFDDGYLDNWVYVYPIIKKYGIKITIFINPEFVDPSEEPRPTLEDVWEKKLPVESLQPVGFLNWNEMRLMEESGLVDIQSHSMSHNTYFKSDRVIDLFDGSPKYDWLPWHYHKNDKPYYMKNNLLNSIPEGMPVFEYDRSLAVRRFIPSDEFIEYCISEYRRYKDSRQNKKEIVEKIKNELESWQSVGRYETDAELTSRYTYELKESKRIIEEKLNKDVRFLCWPGGRYNEQSLRLSMEAGYCASTATNKSEPYIKILDENYKRIWRWGMSSKVATSKTILLKHTDNGLIYCYEEYFGDWLKKRVLKNKRRLLSYFSFVKVL